MLAKHLVRCLMIGTLVIAATTFLTPVSWASLLGTVTVGPGATVVPGLTPSGTPPGTLLASIFSPFSFSTAGGNTSGDIRTAVFREPGGTLDFYYQVSNATGSADAINRLAEFSFGGSILALGYRTDGASVPAGFINGLAAPTTGDLEATGHMVGFNYVVGAGTLAPGLTTYVLEISTNATSFTAGNFVVISGNTHQTLAAFAPVAASVPEPGLTLLFASGLALILFRRKLN